MYRALPVVVFLAAAGCLAGGPFGSSTPEGPPSAPWAEDHSLNGNALVTAHFEALREAGSFTHNQTATVVIGDDEQPPEPTPDWYRPQQRTFEQVDLEGTRFYHRSVTVGHDRASTFISEEVDATRRRPCPTCEWEYRFSKRPPHDDLAQEIDRYRRDRMVDMLAQLFEDWNFTYDGPVRRDGETLYRYHGNWTFAKPIPPFLSPPNGSGTLVVTEDGVIRQWTYRFVGAARIDGRAEPVSVRLEYAMRFYNVGSTTVERPDWVDAVKKGEPTPTTVTAGEPGLGPRPELNLA